MRKRMISLVLVLAMLLSMSTVVFAAESKDWESDIDVVNVANVGDDTYATLEDAFAGQIEAGAEYVSLSSDLTVGDLVLPANAVLNLNGYTLTAESFDSTAAGAQIIDTTGDGLLVVNGEYDFGENDPYLPINDGQAGGFRFFSVEVKSVAVTGKNGASPKYWFQVKFENFDQVYALIKAGSAVDIKVHLNIDGSEAVAIANADFVTKWADVYNTNNGIYITAQIADAEGVQSIVANPGVGANGVDIKGKAL